MSDYKIIQEHSIHTLQNVVMNKLDAGYSLVGGPFILDDITTFNSDRDDYSIVEVRTTKRKYCQAVYKP
jgi:hypothetical protein